MKAGAVSKAREQAHIPLLGHTGISALTDDQLMVLVCDRFRCYVPFEEESMMEELPEEVSMILSFDTKYTDASVKERQRQVPQFTGF
jgi:hypothetical protein